MKLPNERATAIFTRHQTDQNAAFISETSSPQAAFNKLDQLCYTAV